MSIPQKIVQASHASLEAGFSFDEPNKTCHLVLLSAKDEPKVLRIKEYLDMNDISSKMFHEPDYNTGYTAICTEPLYGDDRKKLKKFKLYKDDGG